MTHKRLLRRVAALEARYDPPLMPVCLLAAHGADGEPRLSTEGEARRAQANAAGRPVIIYTLRVQGRTKPDADPFADARNHGDAE